MSLLRQAAIVAATSVMVACGPSPTTTPVPLVGPVAGTAGRTEACTRARESSAQAPKLRGEGRLLAAAKLLLAARDACKPEPFAEDDAFAALLVELGRYPDARAIVAPRAGTSKAAKALLTEIDALERPATAAEVAEATTHARAAEVALGKAQFETALDEWRGAHRLAHPNAAFLVGAGRAAEALGQAVVARALYDRALVDTATASGALPRLELDSSLRASVTFVGWNATGTRFAYAAGATVRVLEAPSYRATLSLEPEGGLVTQAAWAPDDTLWIATSDKLGSYDARTGARLSTLPGKVGVSISADGKMVAYLEDKAIAVVDGAGARLRTLRLKSGKTPVRMVLSPNGKLLAATDLEELEVFDVAGSGKVAFVEEKFASGGMSFSPDSSWLAYGYDNTVRLWVLGKPAKEVTSLKRAAHSIAFSPDGKSLAATGTLTTYVLPARFAPMFQLAGTSAGVGTAYRGHLDGTTAVTFDPTGKLLASGAADGAVKVFKLGEQDAVFTARASLDETTSARFGADRVLFTGYRSGAIRRWELREGTQRTLLGHLQSVSSLALRDDGLRLLSGSSEGQARVWDAPSWNSTTILHWQGQIFGKDVPVKHVGIGPGEDELFVGHEDMVARVWDAKTFRTKKVMGPFGVLAVSHDGRMAIVREAKSLRLVEIAKAAVLAGKGGALMTKPPPGVDLEGSKIGVLDVVLSKSGSHVAALLGNELRVWDGKTGKLLQTIPRAKVSEISPLSFDDSDPPKMVAWGEPDGLRVGKLSDASPPRAIPTPSPPTFVALDASGAELVGALSDGRPLLVDVAAGRIRLFLTSTDHWKLVLVTATEPDTDPFGRGVPVELLGAADELLVCRAGPAIFPAAVCRERLVVPGLFVKKLAR